MYLEGGHYAIKDTLICHSHPQNNFTCRLNMCKCKCIWCTWHLFFFFFFFFEIWVLLFWPWTLSLKDSSPPAFTFDLPSNTVICFPDYKEFPNLCPDWNLHAWVPPLSTVSHYPEKPFWPSNQCMVQLGRARHWSASAQILQERAVAPNLCAH
jgi:hypothetical protein